MYSILFSEARNLERLERIETEVKVTKKDINCTGIKSISEVLQTLQFDEIRLEKCIYDIEDLHRDIFVLHKKENIPINTENAPEIKNDPNKTEPGYSVMEPECTGNEPMHSMNEPKYSVMEPECTGNEPMPWMNEPENSGNEKMHSMNELECSGSETIYSVNEPHFSGNVPMHSMNEQECPLNGQESVSSRNEQKSSRKKIILKIRKSHENRGHSSANESDHNYASNFCNNESEDFKNESGDEDESGDDMDESGDDTDESGDDMDESGDEVVSYDIDASRDGNNGQGVEEESSNDKEISYLYKSEDGNNDTVVKDESSGKEIAKKVMLDLLAENEKEITELVLHLIKKFSRFQRNLQRVKMSVSPYATIFPFGSQDNIERMLESLSGSVLSLDKIVTNIYVKYTEMLHNLSKIFE